MTAYQVTNSTELLLMICVCLWDGCRIKREYFLLFLVPATSWMYHTSDIHHYKIAQQLHSLMDIIYKLKCRMMISIHWVWYSEDASSLCSTCKISTIVPVILDMWLSQFASILNKMEDIIGQAYIALNFRPETCGAERLPDTSGREVTAGWKRYYITAYRCWQNICSY